jgi:hypothetical protein
MSKDSDEDYRRLIDGDPSMGLIAQAPRQHRKRLVTALQVEHESAQEAGMLGYQARILVQCSLPYRRQLMTYWKRTNGQVQLAILADPEHGLPYGAYPRVFLTWMGTEVVKNQSRRVELQPSLNALLEQLDIAKNANGEKRKRFKDQTLRLLTATIASTLVTIHDKKDAERPDTVEYHRQQMVLTDEMALWWDPYRPSQPYHAGSYLILSERFYAALTAHPVPIDLRSVLALKGSALALDIYSWLVYRLSYLKQPTTIPWELLRLQFGGEYADTKEGRYGFKRDFQAQLAEVLRLYPDAKVTADGHGLTLRPSRLAIARRIE